MFAVNFTSSFTAVNIPLNRRSYLVSSWHPGQKPLSLPRFARSTGPGCIRQIL